MSWKLKTVSATLIVIALVGAGLKLFQVQIAEAILTRVASKNAGVDRAASLPDGLHIFICGAGSPMPDPLRAGPCTGIVAGPHVFVVDTGAGSIGNLGRMGFPTGRVEAALLTHLHSDHFDGLGEFLLQSWINGSRKSPTPIWGPKGIEEVTEGFNSAYRIDSTYRLAHHGFFIAHPKGFGATARRLFVGENATVIHQTPDLEITAVSVAHHPADPAFGYRFDYKGRSVTISGDTIYNEGLVNMAKDTDLLLHDALNVEMVEIIRKPLKERGLKHLYKVLFDIQDYHASPVDAARAANDANAGALVLHHIVPPLPSSFLHPLFLKGTDEVYDGEITVAADGMILSLPAGSNTINHINGYGF